MIAQAIWRNPGNRGCRLRKSAEALVWQLRKRTLRRARMLVLANGVHFLAYPDCVVSSALIYADWPEYHELSFLRGRLRWEDVVIDVGANVGHISLLLADIVGWRGIVALEPTPVAYRRLVQNWRLNGWATDRLLQVAAGAEQLSMLVPDSRSPRTTNAVRSGRAEPGEAEVTMVPLDALRTLWNGRRPGLLKVDVEGYESEVFRGARRLLCEDRPRMIMFESLVGSLAPDVEHELRAADYVIFRLDDGQPEFGRSDAQNLFAVPAEERGLVGTR